MHMFTKHHVRFSERELYRVIILFERFGLLVFLFLTYEEKQGNQQKQKIGKFSNTNMENLTDGGEQPGTLKGASFYEKTNKENHEKKQT